MVAPPPTSLNPSDSTVAVVTILMATIAIGCIGIAGRTSLRLHDPRPVCTVIGGACAIWNEPIVDILTRLYFDPNLPTIETFGRQMPLWALCFYPIYYGFGAFTVYEAARRGATTRQVLTGLAMFMAAQVFVEWIFLATDLYVYYGDQPFEVNGLPLYWLFINPPGILAVAVVLRRRPSWFNGWRSLGLLVMVPTAVAASSLGTAWPVFSGLNRPDGSSGLYAWAGAALTIAISTWLIGKLSSALCDETAPIPGARGRIDTTSSHTDG